MNKYASCEALLLYDVAQVERQFPGGVQEVVRFLFAVALLCQACTRQKYQCAAWCLLVFGDKLRRGRGVRQRYFRFRSLASILDATVAL